MHDDAFGRERGNEAKSIEGTRRARDTNEIAFHLFNSLYQIDVQGNTDEKEHRYYFVDPIGGYPDMLFRAA